MNPNASSLNSARVGHPPRRPLLIYDGDCGFCRKWSGRWKRVTGEKIDYEPYQSAASRFPEIPLERFKNSVQLIDAEGRIAEGAQAVFKSLSVSALFGWLLGAYDKVPGFAALSERLYRFVAEHRNLFSTMDSCGLSAADDRPNYFFARGIFLKVLALVYVFAFGSLWMQADGLIGNQGILPFNNYLQSVHQILSWKSYFYAPTLCWFNDSNGFLNFLCGGGVVLSFLLFFDVAPALCLFALWLFYLSLVKVGQAFLSFQWDNLLLEAGLLSLLLVPLTWKRRGTSQAPLSGPAVWMFRWLLFRLMFSSGLVKLTSGDPSWRKLIALRYHYETQPLPTPLAWFMNQMGDGFQIVSCLYMFGVELLVPFLIFGPRRFRSAAFWLLVSLQVLILLTGNYGIFNLLALGLCLFALEDEAVPAFMKKRLFFSPGSGDVKTRVWPSWIPRLALGLVLFMSFLQMSYLCGLRVRWPAPVSAVYHILAPFQSVNSYGLFSSMTVLRPEIKVEGSMDGTVWIPYEFKWKPGDPREAPHWIAPYQPRLDWQMWFAALSNDQHQTWFNGFVVGLLKGSPDILGLLKNNPFPGIPPQFIRANLFVYHFTNFTEKAKTGNWWKSEYRASYLPAVSLKDFKQPF